MLCATKISVFSASSVVGISSMNDLIKLDPRLERDCELGFSLPDRHGRSLKLRSCPIPANGDDEGYESKTQNPAHR